MINIGPVCVSWYSICFTRRSRQWLLYIWRRELIRTSTTEPI
jgi:hypothetical protein